MVIELSLRKRKGHSVIGKKENNCILSLSAFLKSPEDLTYTIVGSSHRSVVEGKLLSNGWIVREKSGNGNLVRVENL